MKRNNFVYNKLVNELKPLTLKAPVTTAGGGIHKFFSFFLEKIRLDMSCEYSAWQRIYMKNQALFSKKDKSENNKSVICCNFAWHFKG